MWWWRSGGTLQRDVERWREAGWVTNPGAAAILAEIQGQRGPGPAAVLSLLGASLLCFAALSFVAAHWNGMPRLLRLGMLLGLMGGAYALAAELFVRKLAGFAQAALLAGVGLFGANIMLVSQMYHINGNPPDAVLMWALGALATGLVAGSRPVLGLAFILINVWGAWETAERLELLGLQRGGAVFWPYLLGWAAVTAAIALQGWRYGLHLCAVALSVFAVSLGYLLRAGSAHELVVVIGLGAAAGLVWLRKAPVEAWPHWLPPSARELDTILLPYALGIAGAAIYAVQVIRGFGSHGLGFFLFWAVAGLALSVAAIIYGVQTGQRQVMRIAYAGFAVEVLTIYFRTIGTLLGSAAFFLLSGVLLSGMAVLAFRFERKFAASAAAAAGAASGKRAETWS